MKNNILELSNLNHTWLIDIDGTVFQHNEYLNGNELILPGVITFWNEIPQNDQIILTTARNEKYREHTEKIFEIYSLRYNYLIMGLPNGERILINDIKPEGLLTALCLNVERNLGFKHIKFKTTKKDF